ncbi:MAG TPA: hypothetical protein VMP11_05270 [Verrucomicrobiae bacterium]|nr:hypothetical protein [Verrucomicrobiae bacterium]
MRWMRHGLRFVWRLFIAIAFSFVCPFVHAQYTDSFQTNIISGVTSNWLGSYYIGYTNFADALLIESNGVLASAPAYLGYNSSSSNNGVLVTGTGSVWKCGSDLYVGNSGVSNNLVIIKGGKVVSTGDSYLGYIASSSNNSVVVVDTGSVWSNSSSYFYVGDQGAGNSLVISNGGQVLGYVGYCYVGYSTASSNNSVLVTDPGSVWNNSGNYMGIGSASRGNSVVVSNGGRMVSTTLVVGGQGASTAVSNNISIIGAGSVWSNSSGLTFGNTGAGNRLVIADGGNLLSNGGTVGYQTSSSNNSVLVTGAGSVWSNSGSICVGYYGTGNTLIISNGSQVINNGGVVGVESASRGNSVVVSGAGSVWNLSGDMDLGWGAASNSLVVKDGGQVIGVTASVGSDSSGTNSVLITGANSVWSNSGTLYVGGATGSGNSMIISNGARMVAGTAYLGSHSNKNKVRVVDGGAWENAQLFIGLVASGDSLVVDGGSVSASSQLFIGPGGSCDNVAELDNGSITVTNSAGTAVLEVVTGQVIMNGGVLRADSLIVNGLCARFFHHGGTLIYRNLVLDPDLSAVGDGIPNGWKQQYGLDPLDPNLANKDVAGTGFTVLQDYLVGVDPTNPAAAFRITSVTPQGNDLLVTWTMGPNRTNALQAAAGDGSGGYSTNGFVDIFTVTNTVGTVTNHLDTGAATNMPSRYYRVRLVP